MTGGGSSNHRDDNYRRPGHTNNTITAFEYAIVSRPRPRGCGDTHP
jgi:hypothetical protein